MAEEIETTVMWVQQLLESVHFVESEDVFEPGAWDPFSPAVKHSDHLYLISHTYQGLKPVIKYLPSASIM